LPGIYRSSGSCGDINVYKLKVFIRWETSEDVPAKKSSGAMTPSPKKVKTSIIPTGPPSSRNHERLRRILMTQPANNGMKASGMQTL
jgi:hypothetical protein